MLHYFGASSIDAFARLDMQHLIQRGGKYSDSEQTSLQSYCDRYVPVIERLLSHLQPYLDGSRSLFLGEYMMSVARIEMQGVPLNSSALRKLQRNWPQVRKTLIEDQAKLFPDVFVHGKYCQDGLFTWIVKKGIPWPRTPSGLLQTDDNTLKDMAKVYPELEPLRQVKKMLSQFHADRIPISKDGKNRCNTKVFGSITGRNQPSSAEWIFAVPKWMRGFIKPKKGQALVMIDYQNQEFGIAATLSGDNAMIAAYLSGDPYMDLAITAGAAPAGATKKTHPSVRAIFKIAVISILYGIGSESLGFRLGGDRAKAEWLISEFRKKYNRFCEWNQVVVDHAYEDGFISTSLGWRMAVDRHTPPLTVGNFPMQATGSDILRLAVCMAHDRNLTICAMIHDALLFECEEGNLPETMETAPDCMQKASEQLLAGFTIHTDSKSIVHCGSLLEEKNRNLWYSVRKVTSKVK